MRRCGNMMQMEGEIYATNLVNEPSPSQHQWRISEAIFVPPPLMFVFPHGLVLASTVTEASVNNLRFIHEMIRLEDCLWKSVSQLHVTFGSKWAEYLLLLDLKVLDCNCMEL
jgi:hypothetical protein